MNSEWEYICINPPIIIISIAADMVPSPGHFLHPGPTSDVDLHANDDVATTQDHPLYDCLFHNSTPSLSDTGIRHGAKRPEAKTREIFPASPASPPRLSQNVSGVGQKPSEQIKELVNTQSALQVGW